jgi:hypothetical protein
MEASSQKCSRLLKKAAGSVLASFRPSTYPRGYASGPSLAAALLNGLFEQPSGMVFWQPTRGRSSYAHVRL